MVLILVVQACPFLIHIDFCGQPERELESLKVCLALARKSHALTPQWLVPKLEVVSMLSMVLLWAAGMCPKTTISGSIS